MGGEAWEANGCQGDSRPKFIVGCSRKRSLHSNLYTFRPEEHIDFKAPPSVKPVAPDCKAMVDMDFSMHAFEHLEVRNSLHVSEEGHVHVPLYDFSA